MAHMQSPTEVVDEPATAIPPPVHSRASEQPTSMQHSFRLVLTITLFVSMWLFWIVFLAGTAAGQSACNSVDGTIQFRRHLLDSSKDCQVLFSYPFWLVFFQFIITCVAMLFAFLPWLQRSFAIPIIALFTMETALLMQLCGQLNSYINSLSGSSGSVNKLQQGLQAAMGGAVVLIMLDIVYICCSGSTLDMLQLSVCAVEGKTRDVASPPVFHTPVPTPGKDVVPYSQPPGTPHYNATFDAAPVSATPDAARVSATPDAAVIQMPPHPQGDVRA